ncbi:HlyD family efflux transporter periplasmic adaptor subunit [Candidatus Sumerlaeota bacterium]|nr:HlyD family efflux transporter periplasmic adaptor subunit [Candidatus Sumerlaeota bacterium]
MAQLTKKSLYLGGSHRFRWWRFKMIPLGVWILAVILGIVLSSRKVSTIDVAGIIETRDVSVISLQEGKMQNLLVDLFDPVEKNQTLALLDDASLKSEFRILESRIGKLRFEWEEKKNQWEPSVQDASDETALTKLNELKAHLDFAERNILRHIDAYNRERMGLLLKRQKCLVDEKIGGTELYDALKSEMDSISDRMKSHEETLSLLKNKLEESRQRSGNQGTKIEPEKMKWIQAFEENILNSENRTNLLLEKKNTLEIRAPLSGFVSRIFLKTGDPVLTGNPILVIVGGGTVKATAYIKEDQFMDVALGAEAKVFSRIHPDEIATAQVVKIGPQMEETPMRLWRFSSVPEWGLPVVIGDLPFQHFKPGEMVDIRISGKTP